MIGDGKVKQACTVLDALNDAAGRLPRRPATAQRTPSSSTSKISVAFGGMTPPAPRAP